MFIVFWEDLDILFAFAYLKLNDDENEGNPFQEGSKPKQLWGVFFQPKIKVEEQIL